MTISLMTPSRTVLLISDEGLYVYSVKNRATKLIEIVSWQADNFENIVVGLIRKECGGKPVLILNDMTDQHFKGGQRIPKVGPLDKSSVIRRKLEVAFPHYPIRGALALKEGKRAKTAAATSGQEVKRSGGMYLFAAVPVSEAIVKTLEAVKRSLVGVAGFYLLPVEASDMVVSLSQKASGKKNKPAKWIVFMGQHQNGSLRQVITRNGQLAMTRMTPVIDSDEDPGLWAQEVSQEFQSTVSYLSRFGYAAEEETDIIVISSREAGEELEKLIELPATFRSMTSTEAARFLGIRLGIQQHPRYADPLHVAWAGQKTRFVLPMEAAEVKKIVRPRQYVAAAVAVLVLSGAYLGWQASVKAQVMLDVRNDLESQQKALSVAKADYQQELDRMSALGIDVALIQGSINTYNDLSSKRIHVLPLIKKIGQALGNDLRLDDLKIERVVSVEKSSRFPDFAGTDGEEKTPPNKLRATLTLSFPPTIEPEQGIREVNSLARRLSNTLSGYEVRIERQIARPEYTSSVSGEVGRSAEQKAAAEDYVAQIVIEGSRS